MENAHIEPYFKLGGPGRPSRICTPITGCFHDKTIISKLLLTACY